MICAAVAENKIQKKDIRMNTESEVIKKVVLPCIAMRGVVAFPKIPVNLEIGRSASKRACDVALGADGLVMLVCQRDSFIEEPSKDDVYTVGVTAKIKQLVKTEEGVYRTLMEPIARAEITDFYRVGRYAIAEGLEKTAEYTATSEETSAVLREIRRTVAEISSLLPMFSDDVYAQVNRTNDVSLLCDFIASNVIADIEKRQSLLEIFDPSQRALSLLTELQQERLIMLTEKKINRKVHERIDKNQRDYYLREQIKAIKSELGEDEEFDDDDLAEYYEKIKKAKLPEEMREKLVKELKKLSKMPFGSAEGGVVRNYIETCLEIPFGKETKDRIDIDQARKILDEDHDGLEEVKARIIEYLAALKLNPELKNQVLCLVGPPGTGKTSVASSIARAMNRKFVRISLGGVRDEADIRGHRKTYIGSMPGRIINALTQAGSMNPLILMDEVDKLTRDSHGDPASALLEVLDTEQNKTFRDHFIETPIDLSDCLFITTANTLSTITQPLIDRMEIVEMKIYTRAEKFSIARHHLIPKQEKRHGLSGRTLKIDDGALYTIIDEYTSEAGVRQLERMIAKCCRRAAKEIVCDGKKSVRVSIKNLSDYVGTERMSKDRILPENEVGTVCGMAYTELGGEIMRIEALALDGAGKIELTGSLGNVMRESAQAAMSFVRSRASSLGIDPEFYKKKDIHIHFPEGAVPKDGPSAGVAIAVAIVSELTGIAVRRDVAMTGEITLRGRVLAIGGLREKTMAAYLAGVKTIILPEENRKDESEILPEVKENVEIIYISSADEAVRLALCAEPKAAEQAAKGDEKSDGAYVPIAEKRNRRTRIEAK